ncbi:hypothetical protein V1511DRAFT_493751 [Dipodascopsis uninucleata]
MASDIEIPQTTEQTPVDEESSARKRRRSEDEVADDDGLKENSQREQGNSEDDEMEPLGVVTSGNQVKEGNGSDQEDDEMDPPLPPGPPPRTAEKNEPDDGWQAIWEPNAGAYYFYNTRTKRSTWTNPRVPSDAEGSSRLEGPGTANYSSRGFFNRFTGKWQPYRSPNDPEDTTDFDVDDSNALGEIVPFTEYSETSKSKRQMSAYFDVDLAANMHDGRSLKAERQYQKPTKKQVQAFKKKKQERKERNRRAWLLND